MTAWQKVSGGASEGNYGDLGCPGCHRIGLDLGTAWVRKRQRELQSGNPSPTSVVLGILGGGGKTGIGRMADNGTGLSTSVGPQGYQGAGASGSMVTAVRGWWVLGTRVGMQAGYHCD